MTRSIILLPFAAFSFASLSTPLYAQSLGLAKGEVEASFCTTGAAPGTTSPGNGGYGLFQAGSLYFADLVPGTPAPPPCQWATPARLRLDLPQLPGLGDVRLNLSTGLSLTTLDGDDRRVVGSTLSPVICTSFLDIANLPSGLALSSLFALELTNGGGQRLGSACTVSQAPTAPERCLWGVSGLALQYGQGTAASRISASLASAPTGSPYLQCYDATSANVALAPAPGGADGVFHDGFESPVPDVRVQFFADAAGQQPIEQLVHVVGFPAEYYVQVSNRSALPLTGVRLREFLPTSGGSLSPAVTPVACEEVAGAAPVACAGPTLDQAIDLAGNATRTFRLQRQIGGSVAIEPETGALLAVAAFVDPAQGNDALPADNARSLRLGTILNNPPTIDCQGLPASGAPLSATVNFLETDTAPRSFDCAVADSDGVQSFAIVQNGNPGTSPVTGALSGGPGNWTLTLTREPSQIGSTTLRLEATDALGGVRVLNVVVNVTDVNSAPSFTLLTDEIRLSPTGGLPRDATGQPIDSPNVVRGGNCPSLDVCSLTFPDFLRNRSVGVQPESPGQQLQASISCAPHSTGVNPFEVVPSITPSSPQSADQPFGFALTYRKSNFDPAPSPAVEVFCTITVTDTGSPTLNAQQTLRIVYNN
ncbi:hypothetical protein SAMN04488509_101152 [Aquimonas voraii]|uniref:Cadherin domain-containing protein n=2 Tax=Aquimonas voraii TaxID=265719 RepID=A0A1G6RWV8_9GAMM|nr:hypothetical protein SAMN04488509_101152 [Aquimonas voraii]